VLPPDTIARAAMRWLSLLRSSTADQAWVLLREDPRYADVSMTQYSRALDWLVELSMLARIGNQYEIATDVGGSRTEDAASELFARALAADRPGWLSDSVLALAAVDDLPADAARFSVAIQLPDSETASVVSRAAYKVDTEERSRIGLAGERGLLAYLESMFPGSTIHVSETDDSRGYDLCFQFEAHVAHIEVKATTRRSRVEIFLSRHEYEEAQRNRRWRLVVCGLGSELELLTIATVDHESVLRRAPRDINPDGVWQSAKFRLAAQDLLAGLPFLPRSASSRA
jgi:hypothetical protein